MATTEGAAFVVEVDWAREDEIVAGEERADRKPFGESPWDVDLEGRPWTVDEWHARGDALPEKFELIEGRLFWSREERLALLAALLENVGLVEAVRLAPKDRWLAALDRTES